jgi:hypothetical protein
MRRIGIAIVAVALARAAFAADEVKYTDPPGWTKGTTADGAVAFVPPNVPAGKACSLMFLRAAPGEVGPHFDQTWKRTAGALKVTSGGKIVPGKTAGGLETRSLTAVVEAGGQKTWVHFFAFQAGPRVEMLLYSANDGDLFDEHFPAVDAMLDSIHLAGAPPPAKAPPAGAKKAPAKAAAPAKEKGPGFDGVFYTAKVGFDAAGAPGARAMQVDYLCFSSDGLVYTGTPTGGPVSLFESPDDSPNYGRYTLDGDDFTIAWNPDKLTKQRRTDRGRRLPSGKVELNGNTYHAIPPCDGLTLDGTYVWKWPGGESVVRFTRDGRFAERGLHETVSDDNLVHPEWPKMPERGSGTYSIRRNTLEVTYDNGPTRRIFFHTRDDPKDVKSITINTYPHERTR